MSIFLPPNRGHCVKSAPWLGQWEQPCLMLFLDYVPHSLGPSCHTPLRSRDLPAFPACMPTLLQDWKLLELDKSENPQTKEPSFSPGMRPPTLFTPQTLILCYSPLTILGSSFFPTQKMPGSLDSISVFIMMLNVSIPSNSEWVSV